LKIVLAFAMVYVCWGSTYWASMSPSAGSPDSHGGVRFFAAGTMMLAYCACPAGGSSYHDQFRKLAIVGILLLSIAGAVLAWANCVPTGRRPHPLRLADLVLLINGSGRSEGVGRMGLAGVVLGIAGMLV
jgi:hypothetical protein